MPSKNRKVSRAGVNAAQSFFESHGCVFQEVAQQNDFGKDAYVDVAQGTEVGALCVALQIKSGRSYRLVTGDYCIPVDQHAASWRESTVPVFGIVYDPDDAQLRWIDITAYLRSQPEQIGGQIPVAKSSILTENALRGNFLLAVRSYTSIKGGYVALNLLATDESMQIETVLDAWALGRGDARFLVMLRRFIAHLCPEATRRAIWVLGHLTKWHPDIFWSAANWVSDETRRFIQTTFFWTPFEMAHMLSSLDDEERGRGSLGQSFHMLLIDNGLEFESMARAAEALIERNRSDQAVYLVTMALGSSESPRDTLRQFLERVPRLDESEWLQDIGAALGESDEFYMY